MSHAFTCNRQHFVFSTAQRRNLLASDLQPKLWAYMAGIARNHAMHAIAIGGVENHVHLLLSLPASMSEAKAIQVIKANSSRWITDHGVVGFSWQRGYGAFSVSASATDKVVLYIQTQSEHHHRHTFEDEFRGLLRKHGISFREDDVFD